MDFVIQILESPKFYVPVLSCFIGFILYKIIKGALYRLIHNENDSYRAKRKVTAIKLVCNLIKYFFIVIIFIVSLNAYGIDTVSIVAGLGVFSAVLGLALQDTLKDFVGGLAIIFENYFVVGDLVQFNDFTGYVIEFGLKSTKLQNFDGDILILANRNIDQIINLSQSKHTVFLRVGVAYEEDVDHVKKVIQEIAPLFNEINDVKKDSFQFLGVDSLDDSAVIYMMSVICKEERQYQVKRDCLTLIKKSFDEKGIKIPYPQLEVHYEK